METDFHYQDRLSVTTTLRLPRGFRNESFFNYQRYLRRQGIFAVGSVNKKDQIRRISERKTFMSHIVHLRTRMARITEDTIRNPEVSSLFKALILGDRGGIKGKTKHMLQQAGIMHLLAVSGLHLGIVLLFFLILFRVGKHFIPTSWISRISLIAPYTRTTSLLSVFPLLFYTILTGMRLSTIRAFIMIFLYLMAFFFDRLKDYYTTLVWAALMILIWNPISLFEIDFQFTFLATWAVIFYLCHRPPLFTRHPWIRKGFDLFSVSAMAFLATLPLSVLYFHYISPAGILLTPIIIPILSLIIPLGLIGTVLLPISQGLCQFFVILSGFGIHILFKGLQWLELIHRVFFPIPSPPLWMVIWAYGSLILLAWCVSQRKSKSRLILSVLITMITFLLILNPLGFRKGLPGDTMRLTFLDVGKGDAALIQCPAGQNIMIDGGGIYDRSFDIGEMVLTPYLWSKGVKRFYAIAISHPHPDHLFGLFALLRNFPVQEVWLAKPTIENDRYTEFARLVADYGIRERILHPGDRISIHPAIEILCLHPPDSEQIFSPRGENSWVNNHSMVLKITYDRVSTLFTGDIEREAEGYLIEKCPNGFLASTILKSPHHGSKNSNTERFIKAARPEMTVISGRQSSWYPLPAPSALKRLETFPTKIFRTDLDGAIFISTNGKKYHVHTWQELQIPLFLRIYKGLFDDSRNIDSTQLF